MEHIFIINPAAGKYDKTAEYTSKIETVCGTQGLNYRIAVSDGPGGCTRIAREAAITGREVRLYACGGDGTLNEVVAGAAGFPNAAVTCFSGGSGNDFVKIFNEPAAFQRLERLLDCEEAQFDLMNCNGDYALNICCVGLDARIGNRMSEFKRLPMVNGSMAYLLSLMANVFQGLSEHYVVEVNGQRIDGEQTFVCVANARYYGGGFYAVPEAQPNDGLLDVLLVDKIGLAQVPYAVSKYKSGNYRQLKGLVRKFRTDHIRILCDDISPINLDGEIRQAKVADIRVSEHKIRFFYPKGLIWKAVQS